MYIKLLKKLFCLILFFIYSLKALAIDVGIICAVKSESTPIIHEMKNINKKTINGVHYLIGTIGNTKTIIVCGGVGSVNTTITAINLIRDYNPNYILFSGSSGAVNKNLNIGDVIAASQSYSLDFGSQNSIKPYIELDDPHPITNKKERFIFNGDENLLKIFSGLQQSLNLTAYSHNGKIVKAKMKKGLIASGDHFPNTRSDITRMRNFSVDCVEMEGSSLMKTCSIFNKKCLVIRGISNKAGSNIKNPHLRWNITNKNIAENNAGIVTVKIVQGLNY